MRWSTGSTRSTRVTTDAGQPVRSLGMRTPLTAAVLAPLMLLALGCAPQASSTATDNSSSSRHPDRRRLRPGQDPQGRRPDRRHRLAGVRPVVQQQRPDQRQGLRVRRRVRRGQAAGLRPERGDVDQGAVQLVVRAGAEEVRLRHQPDLDHPGRARGRRLLRRLLLGGAGGDRAQGLAGRRGHHDRRPQGPQARGPDRHHVADRDPRRHPAHHRAAGLPEHQRRQAGAAQRPGRRDRRRPADRVLHHRGADPVGHDRRPVPAAVRRARSSSGCCSRRATPWSAASTRPWRP